MDHHEIDTFKLMAYVAGDCSDTDRIRISDHLRSCLVCKRTIAELESERRVFLTEHPFESILPSLTKPVVPQPRHSSVLIRTVYALAACCMLVLSTGIAFRTILRQDGVRLKGGKSLQIYVKNSRGEIESRTNHIYSPGEYIQVTYTSPDMDRLVLLSLDEQARISVYFPADGDSSMVVKKGAGIPLPNSILLDDYLGRELMIAVFSNRGLSVSEITAKVTSLFETAGNLDSLHIDPGKGCAVQTILITKKETTR